jgi:hypothetical protein
MKLISMKNKPKKTLRGALKETAEPTMDEPSYPWGLELSLNEDSIKKLNLDIENVSAGDEVYFAAMAKVTRIALNENVDERTGKTNKNGDVGLQIQKMGWGKPGID